MPLAAIIPAVVGAAGSAASAHAGKKAQSQANSVAQQQLNLQKQQYGLANTALGPAGNYWQALLKGGQAAQQAVGPYSSLIGQSTQGAQNAILAGTPRGGEQNLAVAQNQISGANNIARLYAGMQPAAAQGLTGIGQAYLGAGSSLGFPATMAGLGAAQLGMSNAQQGAAGFGSLLYNSLNKLNQGQGGGGSNYPSWITENA